MKKSFLVFLVVLAFVSCNNEPAPQEQDTTQRTVEEHVEYYSNGAKKIEGQLVNGKRHGKWIYYHDNGFVWSEGKYKHGKRDGHSIVYFKNGRTKLQGQYKNDLKVGTWKAWREDGSFIRSINVDELLTKEDSLRLEMK